MTYQDPTGKDPASKGPDLDRGCIKRTHGSGMQVIMYIDTPGVYHDEKGGLVGNKIAEQAGYNVKELARQAAKQHRLAQYQAKADAEFEAAEEKIARLASDGAGAGAEIQAVGNGAFGLYEGGERLTPFPMTLEEAQELLTNLRGDYDGNETDDAPEAKTESGAASASPAPSQRIDTGLENPGAGLI